MAGMTGGSGAEYTGISNFLTTDEMAAIIAGILFSFPLSPLVKILRKTEFHFAKNNYCARIMNSGIRFSYTATILLYSCLLLASGRGNPFIYFNF